MVAWGKRRAYDRGDWHREVEFYDFLGFRVQFMATMGGADMRHSLDPNGGV